MTTRDKESSLSPSQALVEDELQKLPLGWMISAKEDKAIVRAAFERLAARVAHLKDEERVVATTYDALMAELVRLRDAFALEAQDPRRASRHHSGTGSWWELSGYADVLNDAIERAAKGRRRVVRQDRQLEKVNG
jgi:hypothetical protein